MTEEKKVSVTPQRSKPIAFLLLLFLGATGAHNFYLKRKWPAIAQLSMVSYTFLALLGVWLYATGVIFKTGAHDVSGAIWMVIITSTILGAVATEALWLVVDFIWLVFSQKSYFTWKFQVKKS